MKLKEEAPSPVHFTLGNDEDEYNEQSLQNPPHTGTNTVACPTVLTQSASDEISEILLSNNVNHAVSQHNNIPLYNDNFLNTELQITEENYEILLNNTDYKYMHNESEKQKKSQRDKLNSNIGNIQKDQMHFQKESGSTARNRKISDKKLSKYLNSSSLLVKEHFLHVENKLFEMFGDKEKKTININGFFAGLVATGLRHDDPRLKETRDNLKRLHAVDVDLLHVDYDTFMGLISDNLEIIVKAFSSSFVIPDFRHFAANIDELYNIAKPNTAGKPATYIPQLARGNPNHWAVSVCTVDGQRHCCGDTNTPFTLQSCSKPMIYGLACEENGCSYVHSFIGMEPSGRYFNELCLDCNNKPHNPMINAGAIMTAALLKKELSSADRFDYIFSQYKRLCGNEYLGFNNAVFLSEREHADRNFALAYFMRENKCFPEGTKLHETLDFYFQLCSLEINADSGAVIAATLANGGINPLTADRVLSNEAVRNTLTLMHSCGMYNYSGQFAFKVGLPSKSGVSGCVLLVVPNTMGICLWSPNLDTNGNSVRGVQFCMELVNRFPFHQFDNLRGHVTTKQDPRVAKMESRAQVLFDLLFSVAAGDLSALRRHALSGSDMDASDYDGRTALHVAASEGHTEIVEFLLEHVHVNPQPKDRWDRTPLDDATCFSKPRCADIISEYLLRQGIKPYPLVKAIQSSSKCWPRKYSMS